MVQGCTNQTYARKLCIKHGAKPKCQYPGCDSNVRSQGFCCKHGSNTTKNICQVDGCTKVAHARRLCVRHGGGQKCKIPECSKIARSKGLCYHHGGLPNVQSTTTSEDQDMLACILGNVTDVDMTDIDDLLVASCNCDLEFTVEEHEMLDYFIMA
ncbi:unnamed protein product [Aphanomyces euteiches]|nr:hypothetical protein Ae201684P_010277 [Aphanomyces euteiches]